MTTRTGQMMFLHYKCIECKNGYKYFKNLKQHVAKKHPSKLLDLRKPGTANKPYKCDKCPSQFSKLYSLTYHKRVVHQYAVEEDSHRIFQCNECPCKYSKIKYLHSHLRNKHAKNNWANQPQISRNGKCPLCDCSMEEGVILHFSSVHEINVDMQTFEFSSIEECTAWKVQVEKETVAKYIKKRGSLDKDTYKLHYYMCHRSGKFTSESKGHRCLKTQGSNKIGGICPASMRINENKITGKCSVVFITTHIGHENTLGHLSLSSEEREYLATKIACKVSFDAILDDVRGKITDKQLTRLHLLTKKDLHNIKMSLNLSSLAVCHKNDAISDEAWVKKIGNDCVLLRKAPHAVLENCGQIKEDKPKSQSVFHIVEDKSSGETKAVLETLSNNTDEKLTLDEEKSKLKSTIRNLLTLADSLTTVEEVKILKKIVSSNMATFMASCSVNLNEPHTLTKTGPSNKNILPQR